MRKAFLLISFMLFSTTMSYAQEEYLTEEEKTVTEKDLDDAFVAPSNKFIGKKWYYTKRTFYLFDANGTGKVVTNTIDTISGESIRLTYTVPIKWKRNKQYIYITQFLKQGTYTPNASDLKKLSLRKQDETKRKYANWMKTDRMEESNKQLEGELKKITNDIFVLGSLYLFSKNMLDTLNKREQEAKKKAEEAAVKEADNLNEKAYEFAENDNFGEAIATIDKAINLCPNNPNYYDSKGEILYNMGDKDGAKGMWDKVVSLDPKYSEKNTILYKFLFNPEIFNESESDLNSFEEIANRLIRKKNGENVTITNEDYEKFQNLVDKLKKSPYTFKQKKRIREIAKKLQ